MGRDMEEAQGMGEQGPTPLQRPILDCNVQVTFPFLLILKKMETLKKLEFIKEKGVKNSVCLIYHIEVWEMIQLFD